MESTLCATLSDQERRDCRIIETFYADAEGIRFWHLHTQRLVQTAARLGYPCDIEAVNAVVQHAVQALGGPTRCRLTLDHQGTPEISVTAMAPPDPVWRVGLHEERLASNDPWLQVKTTRRALYDRARASLPNGLDEVLFFNERDELCEGSITTLFVEEGEILLTPPLSSGCLPGILRRSLIDQGRAREAILTLTDLKHAPKIYVGNAVRGLILADFRL